MRIFWLGMHKLLVRTELTRLRALGYEVFNPPYLSDVPDQSAELDWDASQRSTLPREVFDRLGRFNFFYNAIPDDIADLLNAHFDAVIVTINADWLTAMLKAYRGKVIYRTYGQIYEIAEHMWRSGAARLILDRPDFWFAPFHALSADREHSWLRERMVVAPYCLSDDVIALQDGWGASGIRPEIMLTCPNIDNAYYAAHFARLKHDYADPRFRIYGVQMRPVEDAQVVGTLPRAAYLDAYRRSSGYLYTYDEPMVCYLPPIEMMIVGGPVLFAPGSLLARMMPRDAPGLARSPAQARAMAERLIAGDASFAAEIIAAQRDVRQLYHPDHVNPIFDATFRRLLDPQTRNDAPRSLIRAEAATGGAPTPGPAAPQRLYVLFHFPGGIVQRREGAYVSAEGIPRVIRAVVQAALAVTDYEIVVTCAYDGAPLALGYLGAGAGGRVKAMPIDGTAGRAERWVRALDRHLSYGNRDIHARWMRRNGLSARADGAVARASARGVAAAGLSGAVAAWIALRRQALLAARSAARMAARISACSRLAARLIEGPASGGHPVSLAAAIDADPRCVGVFAPHYYLFPEAAAISRPVALYLPDYTPHFFPDPAAFPNEAAHAAIGRAIAQRAAAIMTNSRFTRSYIADTPIRAPLERLHVFPLPVLNDGADEDGDGNITLLRNHVMVHCGDRPIIFYPTQNRPNKNIAVLLGAARRLIDAWPQRPRGELSPDHPPVLVLTCGIDDFPPARAAFDRLGMAAHVVFASSATDADLRWLYRRATCLALTTSMEGNFPPQIVEALTYGAPVVATRISLITDELGDDVGGLVLAEPGDEDDLLDKLEFLFDNTAAIRDRQAGARARILADRTPEAFNASVKRLLDALVTHRSAA